MDLSQYLEIFIEESKEHLQGLNESLLQLEKNPEDKAVLNEIFRVAHTLKGMAGTMGFSRMAHLTHDMENVLHAIRNGELSVSTRLVDVLFKCLDALEGYVEHIVSEGNEGTNDHQDIIKVLDSILHQQDETEPAAVAAELPATGRKAGEDNLDQYEQNVVNKALGMGMKAYQIGVYLDKGCVLKSARAFIIFQALERHGEIIKSQPKVEDIEDEKFDFQFTVVVVSKESDQVFLKELNSISEVEQVEITTIQEMEVTQAIAVEQEIAAAEESEEIHTEETEDNASRGGAKKSKTGKTVRVDIERLDILMNLVGELIITKTRLEGAEGIQRTQEYNETIEYLERITTSLNDAVMKVRMVPVETVFNRFPRMIRDISRDLDKEIVLDMSGEETELDRTVIDEIGDPLIHMLRNSADHGIESKEIRRQLGKPEAGHIDLRAYQDGNNVVIEVEDDGQGINLERVKKKALEKGLVNRDMVGTLSKQDIIEFMFQPSFSTVDNVTDLSGRGVGLDVVKTKIETLGGTVEVETELGKGSKFIIRLPLTLAIIQALLVNVGNEKYAIPLNNIKEIMNIPVEQVKHVQKQEVILLRNTVIPLIRLDRLLDVPSTESEQKQMTIVIVRKGDKLSGFVVNSLIGQQEIVIKSLGKLLSGIKSIAGATILGDGNVALILDVNSLT